VLIFSTTNSKKTIPEQYSDVSQVPFASLQRIVDGSKSSLGHSGDVPIVLLEVNVV
jgi:hypothetical protein